MNDFEKTLKFMRELDQMPEKQVKLYDFELNEALPPFPVKSGSETYKEYVKRLKEYYALRRRLKYGE